MHYSQIKGLKEEAFRRLPGVRRAVFERMVEILREAEVTQKRQGGRPNKLSLEDRLLVTLTYLREYRTFFHIAQEYGIAENTCCRTVKWVEETLVNHKEFALPGRKALSSPQAAYEVIVVDATETPIQRPQKNKDAFIQEKRKDTPSRANLSSIRKANRSFA